jgi:hypothetical protein
MKLLMTTFLLAIGLLLASISQSLAANGPVGYKIVPSLFRNSKKIAEIKELKPQKSVKKMNTCYSVKEYNGFVEYDRDSNLVNGGGSVFHLAITWDNDSHLLAYYLAPGSQIFIFNNNSWDLIRSGEIILTDGKQIYSFDDSGIEFARSGKMLLIHKKIPQKIPRVDKYVQCPYYF